MNMFINTFGYQMMSYSKRKLVSNYFKFLKKINFKKQHKLIENKRTFNIIEEKYGTCSLNYINKKRLQIWHSVIQLLIFMLISIDIGCKSFDFKTQKRHFAKAKCSF